MNRFFWLIVAACGTFRAALRLGLPSAAVDERVLLGDIFERLCDDIFERLSDDRKNIKMSVP